MNDGPDKDNQRDNQQDESRSGVPLQSSDTPGDDRTISPPDGDGINEKSTDGMDTGERHYPPDYNPYQAQKKRYKKARKSLETAIDNLLRMATTYKDFGNEEQEQALMIVAAALKEMDDVLKDFYVRYM